MLLSVQLAPTSPSWFAHPADAPLPPGDYYFQVLSVRFSEAPPDAIAAISLGRTFAATYDFTVP